MLGPLHLPLLFLLTAFSSARHLPVLEVFSVAEADLDVLDFIELSFQPLLITDTEALGQDTLARLAPWTFPTLNTSLEATVTFCVASAACESQFRSGEARGGEARYVEEREDKGERRECGEEVPMSLRRFGIQGPGRWHHALTSLTKDLGLAVTLPRILRDADFAFLDMAKTNFHHARAGWAGRVSEEGAVVSASVVCVVEGSLSLTLTPLPTPLATLQCSGGQCEVTFNPRHEQDALPDLSFLVRATADPSSCLYTPPGWQWSAAALKDSTFLRLAWEVDVVIKEEVIEILFPTEEELMEVRPTLPLQSKAARGRGREANISLWEALPLGAVPSPQLWGQHNPLLHLVRRYLLSDRHLHLQPFLDEFKIDRSLLPDLVDCPRECLASAAAMFDLLDADSDAELTAEDATHLTHRAFLSLTHQMDDFVDELADLAREQWVDVVQGEKGELTAFLERAKERLAASAASSVRRWVAGDLEGADEEVLKERLPNLHKQVLAAREATAPADKDEL